MLLAAACGSDKTEPPASRVEGSKVAPRQAQTVESFCDFRATDDSGPALAWPQLAPGEAAPPAAKGWRWLNIWATWCKPCVEELPRVVRWQAKLAAHPDLVFASIDEKAEDVDAFRKVHADAPATLRVAEPEKINGWLTQLGLTGEPPIPIHVFVSPANHIRCTHAGNVRDADYAVVEQILSGR
jgi:thiol-disulfide isomerase/thioredoxin